MVRMYAALARGGAGAVPRAWAEHVARCSCGVLYRPWLCARVTTPRADSGIGDTGASALAEALKTNATVTTLDLRSARRPNVRGVHSVLGV